MTSKLKKKGASLLVQAVGAPFDGADSAHQVKCSSTTIHGAKREKRFSDKNTLVIAETMRRQLVQLVMQTGSFRHNEVVELSQRLDKYIVAIQNGTNRD